MALNSYKLDYVITPMTKAIYHEIISVITVKGYNCTVHVWITEKKKTAIPMPQIAASTCALVITSAV